MSNIWIFLHQVIAEHLSVEEVAGIKEAFEMMDTGKRGKINLEELRVGLQKLGQQIPDPDLQILVESVSILLFLTPSSFWPLSSKQYYNTWVCALNSA